jgi:hypothetical protein
MSRVMRSAVETYEFVSERGEEPRAALLLETMPAAEAARRKSTIAISAAFLVTLTFIGMALLIEPLRPASDTFELRASLTDFSCMAQACTNEQP